MTADLTIHEADSLSVLVPITDQNGAVVSLAAASVSAAAQRTAGPAVLISASVVDAAAGLASMSVTPGQLIRGDYILQLRVSIDGEVQTVVSARLSVLPSIEVTP